MVKKSVMAAPSYLFPVPSQLHCGTMRVIGMSAKMSPGQIPVHLLCLVKYVALTLDMMCMKKIITKASVGLDIPVLFNGTMQVVMSTDIRLR